jgi:3D (Asp-Asp-Asp) domain-containing protein
VIALLASAALLGGVPHSSTSYCLTGRTANGTSLTRTPDRWTRRTAAHNGYPLGTRIWISPAVRGIHRWIVRDRIGYGTQLDLWTPSCSAAVAYGRRTVRVWKGWRRR